MQLHPSGTTLPWKCSSESPSLAKKIKWFQGENSPSGRCAPHLCFINPLNKIQQKQQNDQFLPHLLIPAPAWSQNGDLVRQNSKEKPVFKELMRKPPDWFWHTNCSNHQKRVRTLFHPQHHSYLVNWQGFRTLPVFPHIPLPPQKKLCSPLLTSPEKS